MAWKRNSPEEIIGRLRQTGAGQVLRRTPDGTRRGVRLPSFDPRQKFMNPSLDYFEPPIVNSTTTPCCSAWVYLHNVDDEGLDVSPPMPRPNEQ